MSKVLSGLYLPGDRKINKLLVLWTVLENWKSNIDDESPNNVVLAGPINSCLHVSQDV